VTDSDTVGAAVPKNSSSTTEPCFVEVQSIDSLFIQSGRITWRAADTAGQTGIACCAYPRPTSSSKPSVEYLRAPPELSLAVAGNLPLVKFLVLTIPFALILTAVVAPVLAAAFRRKVTASMNQASSTTPAARAPMALPTITGEEDVPPIPSPAESAPLSTIPAYGGFGPLPSVHAATALQANSRQEVLSRRARNTLR
jgi:hypothetical protein